MLCIDYNVTPAHVSTEHRVQSYSYKSRTQILTCVDDVLVNGAVEGSEVRVGMEVTTD